MGILPSAHLAVLSGFDTEMGQNQVQYISRSACSHWRSRKKRIFVPMSKSKITLKILLTAILDPQRLITEDEEISFWVSC